MLALLPRSGPPSPLLARSSSFLLSPRSSTATNSRPAADTNTPLSDAVFVAASAPSANKSNQPSTNDVNKPLKANLFRRATEEEAEDGAAEGAAEGAAAKGAKGATAESAKGEEAAKGAKEAKGEAAAEGEPKKKKKKLSRKEKKKLREKRKQEREDAKLLFHDQHISSWNENVMDHPDLNPVSIRSEEPEWRAFLFSGIIVGMINLCAAVFIMSTAAPHLVHHEKHKKDLEKHDDGTHEGYFLTLIRKATRHLPIRQSDLDYLEDDDHHHHHPPPNATTPAPNTNTANKPGESEKKDSKPENDVKEDKTESDKPKDDTTATKPEGDIQESKKPADGDVKAASGKEAIKIEEATEPPPPVALEQGHTHYNMDLAVKEAHQNEHRFAFYTSGTDFILTGILLANLLYSLFQDHTLTQPFCTGAGYIIYVMINMDCLLVAYEAVLGYLAICAPTENKNKGRYHWRVWASILLFPWIMALPMIYANAFGSDIFWCFIVSSNFGGRVALAMMVVIHYTVLIIVVMTYLPIMVMAPKLHTSATEPTELAKARNRAAKMTAIHQLAHLLHYTPGTFHAFAGFMHYEPLWVYIFSVVALQTGAIVHTVLIFWGWRVQAKTRARLAAAGLEVPEDLEED